MIQRAVFLSLCFLLWNVHVFAQQKYWVYFRDKDTSGFAPKTLFDEKALEKRSVRGEAHFSPADYPVNKNYISVVKPMVKSTGYASRWLNALCIEAAKKQVAAIRKLPFVKSIEPMQYLQADTASFSGSDSLSFIDNFIQEKQISMMQGEYFRKHHIDGKGIRIAVFDGGFSGLREHSALKHLVDSGRIIKTYDFQHKSDFVYAYATHGTAVVSCIAGMYGNRQLGMAPGAEFLLARTEIKPEKHIEEEYWMEAVEWADQNGADIISSSVGYTSKLYPVEAMDGHTSIVAKAANIAASKGMLVVNSMGNDGESKWEVLCTPADADSVLSVAGVNPFSGYHVSFSSFGPTSRMKLKPNVCAPGIVMAAYKKGISRLYGTSFSAPLVAGFAACVWQMNRQLNNMQIFHLIEKSAQLYPYYDYAHGYGIPQASYFFGKQDSVKTDLMQVVAEHDSLKVFVRDIVSDSYGPYDYLYYHIENPDGVLIRYAVVKVQQPQVLSLSLDALKPDEKIVFFYKKNIKIFTRNDITSK